jgi:hypothetical protein
MSGKPRDFWDWLQKHAAAGGVWKELYYTLHGDERVLNKRPSRISAIRTVVAELEIQEHFDGAHALYVEETGHTPYWTDARREEQAQRMRSVWAENRQYMQRVVGRTKQQ